jgi:hypothetical protein
MISFAYLLCMFCFNRKFTEKSSETTPLPLNLGDLDCVPHRRKKNRRKVRWPKFTPKQTLSKRKITERNIAEIEMIDTKIVEIDIAEFFRSSILVFSHRRIFSPPTKLFGSFFELYIIHRDL